MVVMTVTERHIARALSMVTFIPGSFDKRFVKQLPNWLEKEMTEKGRAKMIELLHKYRRQIPNYEKLKSLI